MTGEQSLTAQKTRLGVFFVIAVTHFVTLLGSSLSRFVFGVWIYQKTGQVGDFATMLVAGFLPGILLSPFVGVLVDRRGPRTLILAGDLLGGAAISSILIALLMGDLSSGHVLIVTSLISCASAMQRPALHTLVPMIVPEEKVVKANGILSTFVSTSDVLGPILAGVLMGFGEINLIMVLDTLTYAIAIIATLVVWNKLLSKKNATDSDVSADDAEADSPSNSWTRDIQDGWNYLTGHRPLLLLVLLFTCLNFALAFNQVLGQPFILTMASTEKLGVLNSIFGMGMVLGGIYMSMKKSKSGKLVSTVLLANAGIGLAIGVSGFSQNLWLVGVAWAVIGFLLPVVNTNTVTILQLRTEGAFLGRVFAMAETFAWVSAPVAYIAGGGLADDMSKAEVFQSDGSSLLEMLFGGSKHGAYGLLLLCTGVFIVITIVVFSRFKSLKQLEEENGHEILRT